MEPNHSSTGEGHRGTRNLYLTLAAWGILFLFFAMFAHNFFSVQSALNLLVQTSTYTILSLGSLLVLVAGGVDLSLGAVIAFSGVLTSLLAAQGIPVPLVMGLVPILCGVLGLGNGFLVAKLRLPSFVVTFATAMVIYGLLGQFRAVALAHPGPPPHPENLDHLGDLAAGSFLRFTAQGPDGPVVLFPGISWLVVIMAVVAVVLHIVLTKTTFGRSVVAVGSNSQVAYFSGLPVVRIKGMAFVAASVLAGLVGVLLTSRMGGTPGAAAGYEMIGITCAMVGGASLAGGTGSVGGTVIGSFLVSTLAMGLTMMNPNSASLPLILNGVIVLLAVGLDQVQSRR